ncbi:S24 family peptidase [Desulfovibrio sp. JY]|nr:S24 family peptidase [Desulfovibrio sp. JY]
MLITQMGFYEDFILGLKSVVSERFDNKPSRLAKSAGAHTSTVTRIIDEERSTWLESIGRIADAAGLTVVPRELSKGDEYAFIPRALARPAAGGGSLETSGETEGCLAFRREWLGRRTRTSPERLRVMAVAGDSMSPTVEDGDIVLVDEGIAGEGPQDGRVYVIRKGEEIYIKRFRQGVGELLFMGDNRARDYQDVKIKAGEEDGFAIIGRVLWAGKEL